MSFLKKIFGNRPSSVGGAHQPVSPPSPAPDPATDPNMIRVFDAYGRELFITREQWRDNVLLGNLEKAKGNPDELAALIVGALRDGFAKDVLPYAEHLQGSDPASARGATLLGVAYLAAGQAAAAERVLRGHVTQHGEDPYVLTNLAKALDARGDHSAAEATLWRALELDPNQDNGFGWYAAVHRERGGDVGYIEACRRVAALPTAWRAQLWLARDALQHGDVAAALGLYQESLSRAGTSAPSDLLMQLGGDLGNAGRLNELVSLVAPKFDPNLHGLAVGNNLIKANLEVGRLEEAKKIVDQLYAENRPDWRQHLQFWDTEIAKARISTVPATTDAPVSMALLSVEGPLWLRDESPCAVAIGSKPDSAPRVAFFGATALLSDPKATARVQLADGPGRLSRALPLMMAEHVHLGTDACGIALIPWIEGKGFALFGTPYEDSALLELCAREPKQPTMIVGLEVDARGADWLVSLRLFRVAGASRLGTAEIRVSPANPAPGVEELARRLMELLRAAGLRQTPPPTWYRRPDGAHGSNYLLRLEQQLAVFCNALGTLGGARITGEHEIVEGAIGLCVEEPQSATARMLLTQTVRQMKKVRPDLLGQYNRRIELLQREHPIAGEPGDCISRALADVLAMRS
jgi:tetratricopeptide (TPR) repeat protein